MWIFAMKIHSWRFCLIKITIAINFSDGLFVVLESHGQSQMEVAIHLGGRRIVPEENHTGFPTFLFQWGQPTEIVLGKLLGVEGEDVYKNQIARYYFLMFF